MSVDWWIRLLCRSICILFFWHSFVGSKIGRWSVLSPLPWFMHSSFHGIDVPRICLHKFGLLTSEKEEPSDNVTFLVEAPLHQVVIKKVYRSSLLKSRLPPRFHTRLAERLPFHLPLFKEGEPSSRLDRTGALPELEQVWSSRSK